MVEPNEKLDVILSEFTQALRRGEDPKIEEFIEKYPQGRETLGELLETISRLENLKMSAVVTQVPDGADPTQNIRRPGSQGTRKPDAMSGLFRPPDADDEIGRLGSYRILKLLGRGGMGGVYLAEDMRLCRQVALKVMLPDMMRKAEARARFIREAQMVAQIEHDHIVAIYEVGEDQEMPFLAMPLLRGQGLEDRLQKGPPLDWRAIVQIGRETALGLAAAHKVGLIHRDIKPGNLWLEQHEDSDTSSFRVKILDFGLARSTENDTAITQPGFILGSPTYMAPEQARGAALDARSDLFSLGVTLYRLCTGQLPFQGIDTMSVLLAVATHDPLPPHEVNPAIPRSLSDLVMDLLAKAREKRPASAKDVVKRLADITAEPDSANTSVAPLPEARKPRTPWKVLVGVGAAMIAMIAALIVLQGNQGEFVIESDDEDISFRINKEKDTVTLRDEKNKREFKLKMHKEPSGQVLLEVIDPRDGLSFTAQKFTIRRGEKVAARAWFRPIEIVEVKPPQPPIQPPPRGRTLNLPGPWGEPENLGPGVNTKGRDLGAALAADECILVYTRDDGRLLMSRRRTNSEPFPRAEPLPEALNLQAIGNPTMTGDGLLLAFGSQRADSAREDIWMCSRKTIDEPFGKPTRLPDTVNTLAFERAPFLSADGLTLLVTSIRSVMTGGDIYMYTRKSRQEPFGEGVLLPEPINSLVFDVPDWISDDGRVLIATRMGTPPFAAMVYQRASVKDLFDPPQALVLPKPHEKIHIGRPWISPDGQRMYFHTREIAGGHGDLDLWMVRRK